MEKNTKSSEPLTKPVSPVKALDERTEEKEDQFTFDPEYNHAYQELARYVSLPALATRATQVVEEFRRQSVSVMNYDLIEEYRWNEDKFRAEFVLVWIRATPPDVTELVDALRA